MSIQEPIARETLEPAQAEPARHKCARCCMTMRVEEVPCNFGERARCNDCGIPFHHAYQTENKPAVARIDPATYAAWLAGEAV